MRQLAEPAQAELVLYDESTDFDAWMKTLNEQLKRLQETASKEYQFDWALERLEELIQIAQGPHMDKALSKIENAKIMIKMDQHDFEKPVAKTGNESTFWENWGAYVAVGALTAAVAGAYWYKHRQH